MEKPISICRECGSNYKSVRRITDGLCRNKWHGPELEIQRAIDSAVAERNERIAELEKRNEKLADDINPLRRFRDDAADKMADEIMWLIDHGRLDARSRLADAQLDYRESEPRSPRSDRVADLEQDNSSLLLANDEARKTIDRLNALAPHPANNGENQPDD